MVEFWYEALASPCGIVLTVEGNLESARTNLYVARREAGDPALDTLSLVYSPTAKNELWIVHNAPKKREVAAEEGNA